MSAAWSGGGADTAAPLLTDAADGAGSGEVVVRRWVGREPYLSLSYSPTCRSVVWEQ